MISYAWLSLPGFPSTPPSRAVRKLLTALSSALAGSTMPVEKRELVAVPPPRQSLTEPTQCDRIQIEPELITEIVHLLVAEITTAVREHQLNVRSDAHRHARKIGEPQHQRHARRGSQMDGWTVRVTSESRKVIRPFAFQPRDVKHRRQFVDDGTGAIDHRCEPIRVRVRRVRRIVAAFRTHRTSMPVDPADGKPRGSGRRTESATDAQR